MAKKTIGITGEEDWRTEHDLRTLMEAECIQKDAKRMKTAQAMAKKRLMDLAVIASADKATT